MSVCGEGHRGEGGIRFRFRAIHQRLNEMVQFVNRFDNLYPNGRTLPPPPHRRGHAVSASGAPTKPLVTAQAKEDTALASQVPRNAFPLPPTPAASLPSERLKHPNPPTLPLPP